MISKCHIILSMYDDANNNKVIKTSEYMNKYYISERTFRRYISEINCYLADSYKMKELVYSKALKGYILRNL